jgi:hypothetical protein
MEKNNKKNKERKKRKKKKVGEAGYRIGCDLLVKFKRKSNPLGHRDEIDCAECVYIVSFIPTVKISTPAWCSIFRHNKHLNFCRTVNFRRLRLRKVLNFKTATMTKALIMLNQVVIVISLESLLTAEVRKILETNGHILRIT